MRGQGSGEDCFSSSDPEPRTSKIRHPEACPLFRRKGRKKRWYGNVVKFIFHRYPTYFLKVPKTKGIKVKAHVRSGSAESIMYIL